MTVGVVVLQSQLKPMRVKVLVCIRNLVLLLLAFLQTNKNSL